MAPSAPSPSPRTQLADGTDIEILNWLDDRSRYLLSCTAHTPVTGHDVATTFLTTTVEPGIPASTLIAAGAIVAEDVPAASLVMGPRATVARAW